MMDKKTAEALEGSIEKWRHIVEEGGEDNGTGNCPLCKLFLSDYSDTSCEDCPVGKTVGTHVSCSPQYMAWHRHQRDEHYGTPNTIHCPECEKFARTELEFLKSLRESTP